MSNWKTIHKSKEYQNPFMEVWKHDVIQSNGDKGRYYVLERDFGGSRFSIIIPLINNKETVLVGQYRYPVSSYSWEFPMGHAKSSSFLDVAKIELREETGIEAKKWQKIGRFFTGPGHSSEIAEVFVASDLSFYKSSPSEGELLKVKKISVTEVSDMIKKGEIPDGPTIVAYHYLEIYLKGNSL